MAHYNLVEFQEAFPQRPCFVGFHLYEIAGVGNAEEIDWWLLGWEEWWGQEK